MGSVAEKALAVVLAVPWIACATGFAYVSVVLLAADELKEWIRA